MRVHGICLVKDESDIIERVLKTARDHFDVIYVFDNGSTDGSWDIVQHMARSSDNQIVAFKQSDTPFHDSLRGEVFSHFKKTSQYGDWWGKLDADEIFIDNPKQFLSDVAAEYECVWVSCYQYYFTDVDFARYQRAPHLYAESTDIEQRIRYYLNNWSELRFVRHVKGMLWDHHVAWPYRLGRICPKRIRMKHFQYRSPKQIEKRLRVRTAAYKHGVFAHEALRNFQEVMARKTASRVTWAPGEMPDNGLNFESRLMRASDLDYDELDGLLIDRPNLLPPLKHNRVRSILPAFTLKLLHNVRHGR